MLLNKKSLVITIVFSFYLLAWVYINFLSNNEIQRNNFTDTYGILAGLVGFLGLLISDKWGSLKSYVGKAIFLFSVSLISQFIGNLTYTLIYRFTGVENAYPSIGEVFYLASIPLYIAAVYYLSKASGFGFSLKNVYSRIVSFVVPILFIGVSYAFFLHGYDFTDMPLLNIFLDFIYPLGQAVFVAFALVVYLSTRPVLGGIMKGKVIFILFALIFQYIADSMFIYETRYELWVPAGNSDLMFLISYFLMGIGLARFGNIFTSSKEELIK